MAKALNTLSDNFNSYINSLERTRRKCDSLFIQGELSRREIEQLYGALFINAVVAFESFIEAIFIGLLTDRFKVSKKKITPKITFKSAIVARDVVFSGRPYVNWLPYEETTKRAGIFFRNAMPFDKLDTTDKEKLKKIHSIRNALVHKSKYSLEQFNKLVVGSLPLIKKEKAPGGFLRSPFRVSPVETRHENLVNEICKIVMRLCS